MVGCCDHKMGQVLGSCDHKRGQELADCRDHKSSLSVFMKAGELLIH
jgi:hypothetical protein